MRPIQFTFHRLYDWYWLRYSRAIALSCKLLMLLRLLRLLRPEPTPLSMTGVVQLVKRVDKDR